MSGNEAHCDKLQGSVLPSGWGGGGEKSTVAGVSWAEGVRQGDVPTPLCFLISIINVLAPTSQLIEHVIMEFSNSLFFYVDDVNMLKYKLH